jgi:predicted transcriptional regulator
MKALLVGIASYKRMKERTLETAKGKRGPARGKPKIWFTSIESFARVLSDRNRELLKLIHERQPESLAELAEMSGRQKSNLSRTLKTMERYGLVQMRRGPKGRLAPRVPYSHIKLDMSIDSSSGLHA